MIGRFIGAIVLSLSPFATHRRPFAGSPREAGHPSLLLCLPVRNSRTGCPVDLKRSTKQRFAIVRSLWRHNQVLSLALLSDTDAWESAGG
jgi:hypothetical protein